MDQILKFLGEWWPLLSPIAAEVLLRLAPTSKSYSIINGIKNVADTLVPNKNASGGTHP